MNQDGKHKSNNLVAQQTQSHNIKDRKQQERIKIKQTYKYFEGVIYIIEHWSQMTSCLMNFGIYLPQAGQFQVQQAYSQSKLFKSKQKYSALFCLGGLGSTYQNLLTKSHFGKYAHKHKIIIVFPDTSPRNFQIEGIPQDQSIGQSAGFYMDATSQKYRKHFRMYSYITQQLPIVLYKHFPARQGKISIMGYSMGGHGALICGIKSKIFTSISALAPVAHPTTDETYGKRAYKQYLQNWQKQGREWDSTQLFKKINQFNIPLFIEVGSNDEYTKNIKVEDLINTLQKKKIKHVFKIRKGYNHSYFYVSTFIKEHIQFHARYLNSSW